VTSGNARPWLIALVLWAAVIFFLSSLPNPPGPPATELRSILAHLAIYAIFGFLAANALVRWRAQLSWRVLLAAWLLSVAYGISDEFHQAFVPNRDSSALDVLANAVGAAGGVAAAVALLRRLPFPVSRTTGRPRPEPPR
jgi:VanZ family protein